MKTSEKGWIKLHRQIQDCWLWNDDDKYDSAHAWIDILLSCNHADKKISFDGKPCIIERGQWLTSVLALSARWGWSRTKVSRFLNVLENDGMIEQERNNKRTLIKVLNYGVFQTLDIEESATEKQQKDIRKTSEEQQKDIKKTSERHKQECKELLKNEKNYKNDKNERNIEDVFFPNDETLDSAFRDFVSMRKKIKKPMTERAIKSMITRLDKLSGGDNDLAILILEQSVRNCWQDVYALKEDSTAKGGSTNRNGGYDWENL